jgi:hypothetical protein
VSHPTVQAYEARQSTGSPASKFHALKLPPSARLPWGSRARLLGKIRTPTPYGTTF